MIIHNNERGDIEDVVVVIIILLLLVIGISFAGYTVLADQCSQYDDTPLKDVPAKCINSSGGTY